MRGEVIRCVKRWVLNCPADYIQKRMIESYSVENVPGMEITVPEKGNQKGTKGELFQICCPATDLSKFIG